MFGSDLLRYAARIAPVVLPYLTRRAMNLHRYPHGAQAKGFWQQALPHHAPDWLPRWDNPDAGAGDSRTYLVVDQPAALVWAGIQVWVPIARGPGFDDTRTWVEQHPQRLPPLS